MAATLTGTAPARPRKLLASRKTRVGVLYALPVVIYLLVLFIYPIFTTLLLSLKSTDGSLTLHWYADALTGSPRRRHCSASSSGSFWRTRSRG